VALPHRRQQLAKFINWHDLTQAKVGEILGVNAVRVANISQGHAYPSPEEITALETLFGLPIETMFEPDMLTYRESWPPPSGFAVRLAEVERRVRAEVEGEVDK
jgi:transcriptional regulator with XRE-family HTH domain